nr:unnamed protein product [Callosobruchus chinensis]
MESLGTAKTSVRSLCNIKERKFIAPSPVESKLPLVLFLNEFHTEMDQTIQKYLIRVVQTKLVGRAQLLVGCRTELTNWSLIKSALKQCFGDNRSLECLEQDLFLASPFKNEQPLEFGKRLQVLRSCLSQKLTLSEPSPVIREAMLKQYEDEDVNITLDDLQDIENMLDSTVITNSNRVNIMSDIQIAPPHTPETDDMTVHTATENPVLEIPFTENVINRYLNQIVVTQKASHNYHIVRKEEIVKFFKEYVDPKKMYCIFIKDSEISNLSIEISKILPRYFKNHAYKICFSNQMLKDISDQDRQKELIVHHHETKTCHRGINETLMALKRIYYWNNMQKMVTEYINNCDLCQTAKYDRQPPKIKFSLTPTPKQPLELLYLDTFRFSNAKFLTIIDVFSKYAQANKEMRATALQNIAQEMNLEEFGPTDVKNKIKNLRATYYLELDKIKKSSKSGAGGNVYTPKVKWFEEMDAFIRNVSIQRKTTVKMLRILRLKYPKLSPKELMQQAILAYNSTIHSVTKQRPFDLINGRLDALDPFDLSDEVILNQYITDRKERLKFLYEKLHESSVNQKSKIIEKRNETREDPATFQPGTSAFIKDKTAAWEKTKPRFVKTTVKSDLGTKIRGTNKKRSKIAHKSQVRKPKKYCSVSQEDAASETASTSSSRPSCSDGAEVSDSRQPNWQYFNSLLFLKNQCVPRKSTGNFEITDSETFQTTEDTELDNALSSMEEIVSETESRPTTPCSLSNSQHVTPVAPALKKARTQKTVKKTDAVGEALLMAEQEKIAYLKRKEEIRSKREEKELDEDEAFFKSILPYVKAMHPKQKLRFRIQVLQLVDSEVPTQSSMQSVPQLFPSTEYVQASSQNYRVVPGGQPRVYDISSNQQAQQVIPQQIDFQSGSNLDPGMAITEDRSSENVYLTDDQTYRNL